MVPIRNPPASFSITGTTEPITNRHLINRYYLPFSRRFGCHYPASGIDHIIYNCATPMDDERMMLVQWLYRNDTRRRVEFHMPSDQPGLVIRKQLLDLLQAHGEEEVYRA